MQFKKLWISLGVVLIASFAVLGGVGYEGIKNAPPIPRQVLTTDGRLLFTGVDIQDGQNVWQSIGGQEIGTVWGHGAYMAPDWSADYLHRESIYMLNAWARETGARDFKSLSLEQGAALQARLQEVMRHNTYDPATGVIQVPPVRAAAFRELSAYYGDVFGRASGNTPVQCPRPIPCWD